MNIYFDSSALAKIFVEEEGSEEVRKFTESNFHNTILSTAVITKAEIMSALSFMHRGKKLTKKMFDEAVQEFLGFWPALSLVEVTNELINDAGDIGLQNKIKGCDAFQLASAIHAKADLLISSDNDLNVVAKAKGMRVWNPMQDPIPNIKLKKM